VTGRNEELAAAMQEKRRSNAAGTHEDRRTKRDRSRADQKRNAIRDQED
jgi:hypothetical protein